MIRKIIQIGTSVGATIPRDALQSWGVKAGQEINVEFDKEMNAVVIRPKEGKISKADERVARLTLSFINRYRSDLEKLARE
ncbi:MAG: hypothetical protein Q8R20_02725 [Nanoarchaeota archaeon]|nr:hypothetical protein [Nanoarchaeota archaeon]